MKIVTYQHNETSNLGLIVNEKIHSLSSIAPTMNDFLQMGEEAMGKAKEIEENIKNGHSNSKGILG